MDYFELGYIGLFLGCFLSATIIPFASEGILIAFLVGGYDPFLSLLVATVGNTLGGATNYLLGALGRNIPIRKRNKKSSRFGQIVIGIRKYGYWMGLLSWLPFVGDPLTILLGYYRVRFVPLLFFMTIGKFLRYAVIVYWWNW